MRSGLLLFGLFFFLMSESVVKGKRISFKDSDHGFIRAHQKLRSLVTSKHPTVQPAHHSADSCQDYARTSSEIRHRSLAPWRTRTVENPDMYPSKYEEAECLCEGCIINGVENRSYNSVPIVVEKLFLKKVQSKTDPHKYSLDYVEVKVTVACTCAVPKQ